MRTFTSLADIAGASFVFESHLGITQASNLAGAWADTQTASGLSLAQANGTKQPAYNASNVLFGGYPTLDWPLARTGDLILLDTPSLAVPVTMPATFIIVASVGSSAANRVMIAGEAPNVSRIQIQTAGTGTFCRIIGDSNALADAPYPVPINTAKVIAAVVDGCAQIYIDGQRLGAGKWFNAGGVAGSGSLPKLRVGCASTLAAGSLPFVGSMAVVACWPGVLPQNDIRRASEMLMRRYQIPLPSRDTATRLAIEGRNAATGRAVA